jgi:hypothetical protein
MKKIIILLALVLSTGISSNINAQAPVVSPPSVSGDRDLRDTNIKTRSIDLERVDRDSRNNEKSTERPSASNSLPLKPEDKLAAKFEEIKTDFEQMQRSQDVVIKTYQGLGKIDYALIGKSALEINKSATRLNSNLFPIVETPDAEKEEKKDNKKEKAAKPVKSVRDLIVDLDNTIGSFTASPMFQNLRIIDTKATEKAKLDLEKIIELSAQLDTEAQKMEPIGK